MGLYCMYRDSLGAGMAIFAYGTMLLGNGAFLWVVVRPKFFRDRIDAIQEEAPGLAYLVLGELILYELFSFMMLWSHLATMCTDPGFIPFNYKYKTGALGKPFQVIEDGDLTGKDMKRAGQGVVDIEGGGRSSHAGEWGRSTLPRPLAKVSSIQNEDQTSSGALARPATAEERAVPGRQSAKGLPRASQPQHWAQAAAPSVDLQMLQTGMSRKQLDALKQKMARECPKCRAVKPPRSHHCSTCGRCVLKMDHHCPWMNNCIGLKNQKFFLLFNMYVMICSAWTVIRVGIASYQCHADGAKCDTFTNGLVGILTFVTCALCAMFTFFTGAMFCDQLSMANEETSTIDRMQRNRARARDISPRNTASKRQEESGKGGAGCCHAFGGCTVFWWAPINYKVDLSAEGQLMHDY